MGSGDPFKRITQGQRFNISADRVNMMLDAARWTKRHGLPGQRRPRPLKRDHGTVLVKNATSGDLDWYEVLKITAPLVGPSDNLGEFQDQPDFEGETPDADSSGQFVVLLEPIKAGEIGLARVAGAVCVQIVGTGKFCDPLADSTGGLQAAASGSAQILWSEAGSSVRWAIVRLCNAPVGL